VIEIRDLTVSIGGTSLIRSLALDVAEGEWVAIIGPNGAGKSTLCKTLIGIQAADGGQISLGGRPVRKLSSRDRARLVAYVPQAPAIPPGLTVADYVLLGRTPFIRGLGVDRPADVATMSEALDHLGLAKFAGRTLSSLSGGERQRVLIARALAQEAPVILLDEPTTSLDLGAQQDVLDLIDRLRSRLGLTVVTTLHDLTLAGQYADRLALMDSGRIVVSGDAREVLTEENIERYYGARMKVIVEQGRPMVIPVRGPVPVRNTEDEAAS